MPHAAFTQRDQGNFRSRKKTIQQDQEYNYQQFEKKHSVKYPINKSQIQNTIQIQNGDVHYDRNFGFGAY
jgi:hypothetical protein